MKEQRKKITKEDIEEYVTITDEDDDTMVDIKTKLKNLKPMEQRIFLTYAHLESYAATARDFNVTPPTIKTYINKIKNKLI